MAPYAGNTAGFAPGAGHTISQVLSVGFAPDAGPTNINHASVYSIVGLAPNAGPANVFHATIVGFAPDAGQVIRHAKALNLFRPSASGGGDRERAPPER